MRHFLFILALTVSGCGSTSWLGWQRARPAGCDVCDGSTCAESSLSATGPVNFDPAPMIEYPAMEYPAMEHPIMEGSALPSVLPNPETIPSRESVPAPTPDPST